MSLTSYRAAPPRDKPLHALRESRFLRNRQLTRPAAPFSVPKGSLRRQPGANADRVRAGITNADPLWKGFGAAFFDFMTPHLCEDFMRNQPPTRALLPEVSQRISLSRLTSETTGKCHGSVPEKPPSLCPRRRLPCPVRSLPRRACSQLRSPDRPVATVARGDPRERGAARAGHLGRFRPSCDGGDHHRRDAVPLCRDQACGEASEEMDGAASG